MRADRATRMGTTDRCYAVSHADERRVPVTCLAFRALRPGMKVLDMGAGAGYSTELDARAVGPTGTVYGQNPPDFGERGQTALATRPGAPAHKKTRTPPPPVPSARPAGPAGPPARPFPIL